MNLLDKKRTVTCLDEMRIVLVCNGVQVKNRAIWNAPETALTIPKDAELEALCISPNNNAAVRVKTKLGDFTLEIDIPRDSLEGSCLKQLDRERKEKEALLSKNIKRGMRSNKPLTDEEYRRRAAKHPKLTISKSKNF